MPSSAFTPIGVRVGWGVIPCFRKLSSPALRRHLAHAVQLGCTHVREGTAVVLCHGKPRKTEGRRGTESAQVPALCQPTLKGGFVFRASFPCFSETARQRTIDRSPAVAGVNGDDVIVLEVWMPILKLC